MRLWVLLVAVAGFSGAASNRQVIFQERFDNGLSAAWKPVEFTGETRHTVVKEGDNSFLKAEADSSASGLAVELPRVSATGSTLTWKWAIDQIPAGGSDDVKKTFDHTARLFVAFRTRIGPPRTLNYVWANEVAVGKTFHHPTSGRARFIVLQNGNGNAGKWMREERDITRDWKMLFGDEDPPQIVGLGFMTDSDGTKTKVTGLYDDIVLEAVR